MGHFWSRSAEIAGPSKMFKAVLLVWSTVENSNNGKSQLKFCSFWLIWVFRATQFHAIQRGRKQTIFLAKNISIFWQSSQSLCEFFNRRFSKSPQVVLGQILVWELFKLTWSFEILEKKQCGDGIFCGEDSRFACLHLVLTFCSVLVCHVLQ